MCAPTSIDVDTSTFADVVGDEDWAIACFWPECPSQAVAYLTLLPCGCTGPTCAGHMRRFILRWPPKPDLILICDQHHAIATNYRITPIKERS